MTCAVFPAAALPINLHQRTLFTETANPKADGDEASRNCTLTLTGHLATAVERQDLPQSSRSWKSAVRLDWGCAETGPIAKGPGGEESSGKRPSLRSPSATAIAA